MIGGMGKHAYIRGHGLMLAGGCVEQFMAVHIITLACVQSISKYWVSVYRFCSLYAFGYSSLLWPVNKFLLALAILNLVQTLPKMDSQLELVEQPDLID